MESIVLMNIRKCLESGDHGAMVLWSSGGSKEGGGK